MSTNYNWAVIIPMANEEKDFMPFVATLKEVLDELGSGSVYLIVDTVSKDKTVDLCIDLSKNDNRFITVWAPENRNVVDAYLRGYKEAFQHGHQFIIEMDAGMSHDPKSLPQFLYALGNGYACAFGSRFIKGGSMEHSSFFRKFLSKGGTLVSNTLLGTNLHDMTSGYQAFHREMVNKLVHYPLLSKGHFYQTEVRYLLRKTSYTEIPIHYKAPSPRVSWKSIKNALVVLLFYAYKRLTFRAIKI